jgi:hypothetical protein
MPKVKRIATVIVILIVAVTLLIDIPWNKSFHQFLALGKNAKSQLKNKNILGRADSHGENWLA